MLYAASARVIGSESWSSSCSSSRGWFTRNPSIRATVSVPSQGRGPSSAADSREANRLRRRAKPGKRHEPRVELADGHRSIGIVDRDRAPEARDHDRELARRQWIGGSEGLHRPSHEPCVDDLGDLRRREARRRDRTRSGSTRSDERRECDSGNSSAMHGCRIGAVSPEPKLSGRRCSRSSRDVGSVGSAP